MKLFDVYKKKGGKQIIQIECFANHINRDKDKDMLIIYSHIGRSADGRIGSAPSFNAYGTLEEIEEKYELLVSQDDLREYDSWEDILSLVES